MSVVEIDSRLIDKVNETYDALTVKRSGSDIGVNINVTDAYDAYITQDASIKEIAAEAATKTAAALENAPKRTVFPQREAFRDVIRESIDMALSKRPKDVDDFLLELRAAGYEIKRGKHTAIRGRGQKRFIRFRSLGEGYTEAEIKNKIGCSSPDKNPYKNVNAKNGEKFDLLLFLQDIIAKGKGPGYELWAKKYNVKKCNEGNSLFPGAGIHL